jgi:ubiquinone biosynthesis accessory factor UbiJ
MATQSPFPFLDTLADRLGQALQPPAWVVDETHRRLVLLVNHVLAQEPEAMARLARQRGRVVLAAWRQFEMRLVATPAGLLDLAAPGATPDLTLTLTQESPWALAQTALRGDKPQVRIAGDVQFAAEINWLVDHVRWDMEEDLARVVGDAPAHALTDALHTMVSALRRFITRAPGASGDASTAAGGGR